MNRSKKLQPVLKNTRITIVVVHNYSDWNHLFWVLRERKGGCTFAAVNLNEVWF